VSQQTVCDGCGKRVRNVNDREADRSLPLIVISGERASGPADGIIPSGRFDWCGHCAHVAFRVVKG
jgi:hypothetical protein